jgi:hypothetical protein
MKLRSAQTAATVEASFVTIDVILVDTEAEPSNEQSPIAVIISEFGLLAKLVESDAEGYGTPASAVT